jgi:hypothetical protein
VDGRESRVKDCLQQSKRIFVATNQLEQHI